ncbi:hypothetical protein GOV12_06800 [Candidatus Pacearchaeota archaeon]|nr:hypothetical protein [Candidatus Pacearchaeota archaeon]
MKGMKTFGFLLILIASFILFGINFVNAADFVEACGTEFCLDGEPFYFSGTNIYYLPFSSEAEIIDSLDDAVDLGLKVVRTWGFCDGACVNEVSFQTSPGVYNEEAFLKMDFIIDEARKRDLKLIIPLVNNWDDYGGMCEYVKWCGLPNSHLCDADEPFPFSGPTEVHDKFYTDECTKDLYKNYVNYFLNRSGSITWWYKYKDDPTIFAWELANEPRVRSNKTGEVLNEWIIEMSEYVKSIDSNHMVTPGGDGGYLDKISDPPWSWWYHGNEGQDFIGNHESENIDFATFRYYPESGKFNDVNHVIWIEEHISDSHNILKKPVIMEEFGSVNDKRDSYLDLYGLMEENSLNGDLFWMLSRTRGVDRDGYEVLCPEDNLVCEVIEDHAKFMNDLNDRNCVVPYSGMEISEDTLFCPGEYEIDDTIMINQGSTLDCNNTVLKNVGDTSVDGIRIWARSSMKNCVLEDFHYSVNADYNEGGVFENNIFKNCSLGFHFHNTRDNVFIDNTFDSCTSGFYIWYSSGNIFENNVMTGRGKDIGTAFSFNWHSSNNDFIGNKVSNFRNAFSHSMTWTGTMFNNTFVNNEIKNNYYGIYLGSSFDCLIKDNLIEGNEYGIRLVSSYTDLGSWGYTLPDSFHNIVIGNKFIDNVNSAYDNDNSSFDNGILGNYWSEYDEGNEGCNDLNNNYICDEAYLIDQDRLDNFPLILNNWCSGADMDEDGKVWLSDWGIFRDHFGQRDCLSPDWCESSDIDEDGRVFLSDWGVLRSNFGKKNCIG